MLPILSYLGRFFVTAAAEKVARVAISGSINEVATSVQPMTTTSPLNSDNDVQLARETILAPSHDSWFDVIVDAAARLPRPIMAFWVLGILFGWWAGPDLAVMDAQLKLWIEYIMGFYFGHRAMSRDIPIMISGITSALRK